MRRTVLLIALVAACARGRSDEPVVDGATADGPEGSSVDAPRVDAPTSTGTCAQAFTGTLATWSFAGQAGNQASTPATSQAMGITAGAVTRSAALTANAGTNSINASNWPLTATRDATKYYAFTIAPPAGCTLSITGVNIDVSSSGTGPASAQIATSADNYVAASTVSTTTAGLVAATVTDASAMVEVRVYGYAATAAGGTMRIQTSLSVAGQLK
ncbi:MAG: hypothetical protein M4D80_16955 [Myxococcota bacterium]|nr:hypothetical protein [Myxococcota bacterium]